MEPQIDIVAVWNYIAAHQWVPLLALLVGACVRLLKDDTVLPTIPTKYRAWAALGMGLLGSTLQAVVAGTPWSQAILHGLAAGFSAIMADNLFVKMLPSGDVPLPKVLLNPPADPPKAA
jgi:hypothetical protein